MKLTLLQKIFELTALSKAVFYKKGALILLSAPASYLFTNIFKSLMKEVDIYNLALPVVSISSFFLLYVLFWITDFWWGLKASKKENVNVVDDDWIESDKLYNSAGKLGGMLLIEFVLLFISIFLVLVHFNNTSIIFLVFSICINVLIILYEYHSIGENIKRVTDNKPKHFILFEKVTTLLEEGIFNKIKSKLE
ncbi:phage holin family protein [Tenacibaculum maritimum]|uniref:phage holin family protein n=1 Tax=Tenacibaculum maritimum TaxID=107401 RepID=UPI0012E5AC80|nr:phage holin family protein [Tenacibaculum maritimum]CAA0192050.1 membrane hypothetical protein [Tenacibaculum maritimum]